MESENESNDKNRKAKDPFKEPPKDPFDLDEINSDDSKEINDNKEQKNDPFKNKPKDPFDVDEMESEENNNNNKEKDQFNVKEINSDKVSKTNEEEYNDFYTKEVEEIKVSKEKNNDAYNPLLIKKVEEIKVLKEENNNSYNSFDIKEAKEKKLGDNKDELKLQKEYSFNLGEKANIYNIYELSNKRIAILEEDEPEIKIYSLNGNLLTKLEHNHIKNIIELKNSDLVICTTNQIYIYKLKQNNNYELYQSISPVEPDITQDENFNHLLEILVSINELKNGSLITWNSYCIKIYKKDKDDKFTLSAKKKFNKKNNIIDVFELKNNVLIIFQGYYPFPNDSMSSLNSHNYIISKYDIEKNELKILNKDNETEFLNKKKSKENINYLITNNYLFVIYNFFLDVYDIAQNLKLINENNNYFFESDFPIYEFLCNYEGDCFLAKDKEQSEPKLYMYKNGIFQVYKNFPIIDKSMKGIIKLRDNYFLIYTKNIITIYKKC